MADKIVRFLTLFLLIAFISQSPLLAVWNIQQESVQSFGNAPAVSTDADGNAVAVWGDADGSTLYSSFFQNKSWSQPIVVASSTGFPTATVFAYSSMQAIAVWQNQNDMMIYVSRLIPGSTHTWDAPLPPLSIGGNDQFRVACDELGNIALIYFDVASGFAYMFALPVDAHAWTTPQTLESSRTSGYPVAITARSGLAVAFYTTPTNRVQAASYTFASATGWTKIGSPLFVPTGCTAIVADMNSSKMAAVGFGDYAGLGLPVQVALFDAGVGTWGPLQTISGSDTLNPSIAIDATGNASALWVERSTLQFTLRTSSQVGAVWQPSISLSDSFDRATWTSINNQIMLDKEGNALAIWNVQSTANSLIQVTQKPIGGNWDASTTLDGNGQLTPYAVMASPNAIASLNATFAVWEKVGSNIVMLADDPPAGSLSTIPEPARKFRGSIKKRHGRHKQAPYKLSMRWKASRTQGIASYEIYENSKKIAALSASNPYFYKQHLKKKHLKKKYRIQAVDAMGNRSHSSRLKLK